MIRLLRSLSSFVQFPQLEDKEALAKRIKEATQHIALEQLAVSGQCGACSGLFNILVRRAEDRTGFSSTKHGNNLTPEEQWAKVDLIADTAKSVWGKL